ncbi:MAG TPA: MalY/PatB family protein [Methylomirabilota bacterium]|nr:MalY/PatB family protein [Methylomirabilota bacterium]
MTYDFDRVIDRRHTLSNKWRKYPADVLPFWVADMDFRSPEPVVRAMRERVEHGVYGYGFDDPEFAEVFADRAQKRYGWKISPEAVVLVAGVIPGFNVACRALTSPGDGLLMQVPVYPPILRSPGNHGLTRDAAPLGRQRDGRYVADLDALRAAIHERTRAFLLCNPHNPVGRVFTREELTGMAATCLERGLPIIADEIHCDLLYSGQRHVPIASLGPEVEQRTITLMAPSKTFNLAGLKVSVAVIPNASLRERFLAARGDLVQAQVNIMGYAAALAAYRDGHDWLEQLMRYLEANRDYLAQYVARHLPGITMVTPEGTYLAWLDCCGARPAAADPFTFFLERAKVAFNDGALFGPGGEGFVRLNFGTPRALLTEGLERMRRALGG